MKCPACFNELTEMQTAGVAVDICHGGCGGIWFDAFELQRFQAATDPVGEQMLRIERDPLMSVDHARKRECPRCDGVKLKRHFSSAQRQVEVDQCPNCAGYWLDAGELEKVRAEKAQAAAVAGARSTEIPMATIRALYRQRLEERSES
jgi:Zn-finger nucleic acid-binding protein